MSEIRPIGDLLHQVDTLSPVPKWNPVSTQRPSPTGLKPRNPVHRRHLALQQDSNRSRSFVKLPDTDFEVADEPGLSEQANRERQKWASHARKTGHAPPKRPQSSNQVGRTIIMSSDSDEENVRAQGTGMLGESSVEFLSPIKGNMSTDSDELLIVEDMPSIRSESSSKENEPKRDSSSEVCVVTKSLSSDPKSDSDFQVASPDSVKNLAETVQVKEPSEGLRFPLKGPQLIEAPVLSVAQYNRLISNEAEKRNFAGKMTMARYESVQGQTNKFIAQMHKSLSSAPDEKSMVESPEGLNVDLMPHQKQGLAWLLWRENQDPPSGILADDMGLGKTLSMISLILEQKNRCRLIPDIAQLERQHREACRDKRLVYSKSTLVVAPASLILQWEKEIKDRLRPGILSCTVFHGNRKKVTSQSLAQFDVVITTYGTLTSDVKLENNMGSVLAGVAWQRIILDEAHTIKNRKTKSSRVVCQLSALRRWCLTGTPIQNELWDLFSLMRFMKVHPFSEENHWKMYIMTGANNSDRLNTLVKGMLLRRTKESTNALTKKPILSLPKRLFVLVELEMKGAESRCYQLMFEASRQKAKQIIQDCNSGASKAKNPFLGAQGRTVDPTDRFQVMSCLLALLLRLRQACVHLSLTRNAIDIDTFKNEGLDRVDEDDIAELERTLANISLCGAEDDPEEQVVNIDKLFTPAFESTKIRAIIEHLSQVIERREKVQWTNVLDIIRLHLDGRDVDCIAITGQMKPKDRQQVVDDFNSPYNHVPVLLLSLTAGGVGLNLVGGNHLFLVDLHWNPAMEQQAFDRIYRMGQTKDVFVKKFIVKDSIEQRVLQLQEKKIVLAKSVLEGSTAKDLNKLTVKDLEFLFDLNPRKPTVPKFQAPTAAGFDRF